MSKFLSEIGVSELWSRIKLFFYTKIEIDTKLNGKASTSVVTTSSNGLMSSGDKTKLNGIADDANNYSLPTASSTLGGVKTTSTVTDVSAYTPTPIVDGVPYYKGSESLENKIVNSTLSSVNWLGSEAPYSNTITLSDNVDDYNVGYITIGDGATNEQKDALVNAEIDSNMLYNETARTITFYSFGIKPSIDIPIKIVFSTSMDIVESIEYEEKGSAGNDITYSSTEPTNMNDKGIWFETT